MFLSVLFSLFCGMGCDPSEYTCGYGASNCGFVFPSKYGANLVDGDKLSRGKFPHYLIHFYLCGDNHDARGPSFIHFIGDFLNFGKSFAGVQLFNPCWFLFSINSPVENCSKFSISFSLEDALFMRFVN